MMVEIMKTGTHLDILHLKNLDKLEHQESVLVVVSAAKFDI